jgi:hypothetical protein
LNFLIGGPNQSHKVNFKELMITRHSSRVSGAILALWVCRNDFRPPLKELSFSPPSYESLGRLPEAISIEGAVNMEVLPLTSSVFLEKSAVVL